MKRMTLLSAFFFLYHIYGSDLLFLNQVASYVPYVDMFMHILKDMPKKLQERTKQVVSIGADQLDLFRAYPELKSNISYIHFASLPTPIELLAKLSEQFDCQLYIKRDDKTGSQDVQGQRFGGNKVRKLEFLLADAMAHNKKGVMTFGCAGSNHALATATYAAHLDLDCFCMLKPQPHSWVVQRNLLSMLRAGAEMHYCPTSSLRTLGALYISLRYYQLHEQYPYIIPTGGSNAIGVLGFVNAAFELKRQIEQGLMPKPDVIYVPIGSSGTITGLLLGLKAAEIDTKVIGVAVEPPEFEGAFEHTITKLFDETQLLLKQACSGWSNYALKPTDYGIVTNLAGLGYGIPMDEAQEATELLYDTEGIVLDGTYSAKACAGMFRQLKEYDSDTVILFWLTFDGQKIGVDVDYQQLPLTLHRYFVN